MQFILIHGSFGNPNKNWLPQLKKDLLSLEQNVLTPKFPCDDWDEVTKSGPDSTSKHQNLKNWLKIFEADVLPKTKGQKICFVGHSLSPLFILHIVDRYKLDVDSAIFASPFLRDINRNDLWQFKVVNKSFYKTNFDFNKLKKRIPESYVLYSESDPYIDTKFFKEFGKKMGSSMIRIKKAGHLNAAVNLNEFPLIYELCKSRLDLNVYQKYIH